MTDLCTNNGTCINTDGSYKCICEAGWQGQHCEDGKMFFPCQQYFFANLKLEMLNTNNQKNV